MCSQAKETGCIAFSDRHLGPGFNLSHLQSPPSFTPASPTSFLTSVHRCSTRRTDCWECRCQRPSGLPAGVPSKFHSSFRSLETGTSADAAQGSLSWCRNWEFNLRRQLNVALHEFCRLGNSATWSISDATLGLIRIPVRLLGVYAVALEITSADTDVFNILRYQCIGVTEREKLGLVSSGSSTLIVTRVRKHVRLVIGLLPTAWHSVAPPKY